MVLLEAGQLPVGRYLNLHGLRELRGISHDDRYVTMGALTTYTEIRRDPVITRELPMLVEAAGHTGAIAIQNRGTIGGNIANASPAADSPPALLAYEAEVELASSKGRRWVPYDRFHLGYKKTAMAADELLTAVRVPRVEERRVHYYRKVGTRRAQAISKVCIAAVGALQNGVFAGVRIGWGSVAPVPQRSIRVEAVLGGSRPGAEARARARVALRSDIAPIDDIRSTRDYRARVSENLLADFIAGIS